MFYVNLSWGKTLIEITELRCMWSAKVFILRNWGWSKRVKKVGYGSFGPVKFARMTFRPKTLIQLSSSDHFFTVQINAQYRQFGPKKCLSRAKSHLRLSNFQIARPHERFKSNTSWWACNPFIIRIFWGMLSKCVKNTFGRYRLERTFF